MLLKTDSERNLAVAEPSKLVKAEQKLCIKPQKKESAEMHAEQGGHNIQTGIFHLHNCSVVLNRTFYLLMLTLQ